MKKAFVRISVVTIAAALIILIGIWFINSPKSTAIMSDIFPGEVVVGFEKGVSQADAEELLSRFKLSFIRTKNVNMGKGFFYETGENFIIKVPAGKEKHWIHELESESTVKQAAYHNDPTKVILD